MPFPRLSGERGAAVVEVTLVLAGLLMIFLALLQLAVTAFAHTYIAGVTADAARAAAASTDLASVERRLEELLVLPMIEVDEISLRQSWVSDLALIRVQVRARVPSLVPLGAREIDVTRHALIDK
jgi:hypothetical protein